MQRQKWTDVEDKLLSQLIGKVPVRVLTKVFARSECGVRTRARNLGLNARKTGQWHHRAKLENLKAGMIGALSDAGYTPMEIHRFLREPVDVSYYHVMGICQCRERVKDASPVGERRT